MRRCWHGIAIIGGEDYSKALLVIMYGVDASVLEHMVWPVDAIEPHTPFPFYLRTLPSRSFSSCPDAFTPPLRHPP